MGFFQPECNDHDVHLPDHAEMYGTVQRFFGICGQHGEDTDHDRGNRVGEYFPCRVWSVHGAAGDSVLCV